MTVVWGTVVDGDAWRGRWPEELPGHLSASSLTAYHRCREQWRARYLDGQKEPPKGYLVWGSADSAAAAYNFSQKIESHTDVPVAEVAEIFAASVDEEVDRWGGASQIEWDAGQTAADVKDQGTTLAALYHREVAPVVQPIAAERRIEFSLADVPVPIIGYLDVETSGTIVERKTAKQKFRGGVPDGSYLAQARVYQLAVANKPLHFHVSTKTKLPAVWTPLEEPGLLLPYDERKLAQTERWIRATVRSIISDWETFGPAGPWPGSEALRDSPCSWCGYGPNAANTCRWWA